jgi:hypothetical protein
MSDEMIGGETVDEYMRRLRDVGPIRRASDDITVTVTLPREQAQAFVKNDIEALEWHREYADLWHEAQETVARALADALGEDGDE